MASALVVSSAVVFFRVSGGGPGVSVRVAGGGHTTRGLWTQRSPATRAATAMY
jgi:hypothetical protein